LCIGCIKLGKCIRGHRSAVLPVFLFSLFLAVTGQLEKDNGQKNGRSVDIAAFQVGVVLIIIKSNKNIDSANNHKVLLVSRIILDLLSLYSRNGASLFNHAGIAYLWSIEKTNDGL
jgi:hypothetical protein